MFRRMLAAVLLAAFAQGIALAEDMPSAGQVEQGLGGDGQAAGQDQRVTVEELKRRPDIRGKAPSIDISSINFAFNSAVIPPSQSGKVKNLGLALSRLIDREPKLLVLIEGYTDTVGSAAYNKQLSQRRAAALKRLLVDNYGIPASALETVGYGEEYLAVPDDGQDPRNRRVTLRRIDGLVK